MIQAAVSRAAVIGAALVASILLVAPARAGEVSYAGMTLEWPDGWVRDEKSDGVLLRRVLPPPEGRKTKPGVALLLIRAPLPAAHPFDAAFDGFARSVEHLKAQKPTLTGKGTTINGHAVRWEKRCCGSGAPRTASWDVGVAAPGGTYLVKLLTIGASRDEDRELEGVFQTAIRSFRPTPSDRAFTLTPTGGGFEGLYSHLNFGNRLNPFGGFEFYSEQDTMLFDRSGLYTEAMPKGESIAALCAERPRTCGTYRVLGDTIEVTDVLDAYGLLRTSRKPFVRNDAMVKIGATEYRRVPPITGPLDGTWTSTFASVGNAAFSSTSVSSSRTLSLTRDGRWSRTGFVGFNTSNSMGDSSVGVAGSSRRPMEGGRYRLEGYTLILTQADGTEQILSVFAPDVGSDGLLVINGSNYLKAKR